MHQIVLQMQCVIQVYFDMYVWIIYAKQHTYCIFESNDYFSTIPSGRACISKVDLFFSIIFIVCKQPKWTHIYRFEKKI